MFYPDKIQGKKYAIKNQWREVTISEAIELSKIELPDYFTSIYKEIDAAKREELVLGLKDDDFSKIIPDVQSEVLCLLSDIPRDIAFRLEPCSLTSLYNEVLAPIHLGIILHAPGDIEVVKDFKYEGQSFMLPSNVVVMGNEIPMYNEQALPFCDAIELARGGIENYSAMVATLCRPKGEVYNEDTARVRADMFKELPMSIAWNAFVKMNEAIEVIDGQYSWIFGKTSTDAKVKTAFNKSRLNRFGCIAWLYEVAESGICGDMSQVSKMPLYEFMSVLSYLRSKNKLSRYAEK